ncbi:MAG: UDP-2,3-diacylglucosamine diphosphatase LpxI [Deltaproteobacteria bacterium]|nr:UDP-2,3-diacylglucosamine diphosphatase LpxI [Deltaproteobacteria bacterium]
MSEAGGTPRPVGIVAGNGVLPRLVARSVRAAGGRTVAVAIEGETDPSIEEVADEVTWVRLGQLGKMRDTFVAAGVERASFAGGVTKVRFFRDAVPDLLGAKVLAKLATSRGDDRVLRAVAGAFEEKGIVLLPATSLAPDLTVEPGVLGARKPSARERDDIELGRQVLAKVGALDIGQVVVIREGVVLAVEATEGTDACIRRGVAQAGGAVVVVKASKPGQDLRFDQPAVGPETITSLVGEGAGEGSVLAFEAGTTLLLEREALLEAARGPKIALVAFARAG